MPPVITTDTDLSVFGITGSETMLSENGLSEPAMLSEASAADAAFTGLGVIRGGGISAASGLAAAIINGAAVGLWINHTYGQPAH